MSVLRTVSALKASSKTSIAGPSILKRSAHDLLISRSPSPNSHSSGKTLTPIIRHGPPTGGRSASNGHVVTVFGCTGFLGRYLVHKLAKQGTQVIVPYRDEDDKRHLKVMGDLGQIVPMEWDLRNPTQIEECLRHSDTVYNLTGRDWETRNYKYEDVNVTGAHSIASIAAQVGVPRLIHLSHLNATPDSTSAFYRTKYEGEVKVREAFPEATIVRPGPSYGGEDWLLNAIASYPSYYHLNNAATKTRPVHILDVAEALNIMLTAPLTSTSSTFLLAGPQTYTYTQLIKLVEAFTLKSHTRTTIPKPLAMLFATLINRGLWWPTISPDEVERRYIDDIGTGSVVSGDVPSGWEASGGSGGLGDVRGVNGEECKGWVELNMTPDLLEEHAIKYLRRYRSASNFDAPVEMGHFKPPKAYHVVE